MSESSKDNLATPLQRTRQFVILIVAVVIILGLGYASGYFVLPGSIKSAYQNKNCESVISMEGIYTSIYPSVIANKSLTNMVRECAVYSLAIINEDGKAWRDSFNAFSVYSETYPEGLFVAEAHEHSAVVLTSLAKEEIDQKKYVEAIGSLNFISADYKDTKIATEVANLIPEVYAAWGTDLRATGDYVGAERTFNDLKTWAENNQQTEQAQSAQHELAQTYMEWGADLQSQKRFDDAQSKFDLAVSFDPGFAKQIQAGQIELYRERGDHLVEQGDFVGAMEQYETASALSKSGDPASASDILANGYIQWAIGLSVEEDFMGALVLLDFAEENAVTDSMKNRVGDARSDVYLAFSESNGEQARRVMDDVVEIICKHHIQPRLPIFGLDQENDLFGIYGVDNSLPEDIAAKTPGSLHYVACIEEDAKIIESEINTVGSFFFDPNPPYTSLKVQYNRVQYIWTVIVRKADTGNDVESTIVNGGDPPPLPTDPWEIVDGAKNPQYFGTKPSVADLVNWLLMVLR